MPSHEEFMGVCATLNEPQFRKANGKLSAEEAVAAEGLAWKVLIVGWKRAIEGHADSAYITVTNPAPQQKEKAAEKAGVTVNGVQAT
jgi:hypothetical protein